MFQMGDGIWEVNPSSIASVIWRAGKAAGAAWWSIAGDGVWWSLWPIAGDGAWSVWWPTAGGGASGRFRRPPPPQSWPGRCRSMRIGRPLSCKIHTHGGLNFWCVCSEWWSYEYGSDIRSISILMDPRDCDRGRAVFIRLEIKRVTRRGRSNKKKEKIGCRRLGWTDRIQSFKGIYARKDRLMISSVLEDYPVVRDSNICC